MATNSLKTMFVDDDRCQNSIDFDDMSKVPAKRELHEAHVPRANINVIVECLI